MKITGNSYRNHPLIKSLYQQIFLLSSYCNNLVKVLSQNEKPSSHIEQYFIFELYLKQNQNSGTKSNRYYSTYETLARSTPDNYGCCFFNFHLELGFSSFRMERSTCPRSNLPTFINHYHLVTFNLKYHEQTGTIIKQVQ